MSNVDRPRGMPRSDSDRPASDRWSGTSRSRPAPTSVMMSSLTDERFDRRGLLERAGWLAVSAGALPVGLRRGEAPDLAALQRRIAGTVVAPGAAGYDAARLLYSPRFDGTHPLAVVYCESAADVSRTILWARLSKVPIAARSGGHSYAGYSTTPGVVIDVSRLASITVNAASGTVGIGAGARLMDVYRELAARGLTIPAGSCPSVGIAGLALGGGVGFAGRKLGLTCDNLRSFTMVTADGVVRPCNAQRNPGPVLGLPWRRWREFRRRHTVHVHDSPGEHRDDLPGRVVVVGRGAGRRRLAALGAERTGRALLAALSRGNGLRWDACRLERPILRDVLPAPGAPRAVLRGRRDTGDARPPHAALPRRDAPLGGLLGGPALPARRWGR